VKRDKFSSRPPQHLSREKVLILCSGKTERLYFDYFKKTFEQELQNVNIEVLHSKGNLAMNMVCEAIKKKSAYNVIWIVFDRDVDKDFDKAIEKAEEYDIYCAFSNIAFEYWLLLHLIDTSSAMSAKKLIKELSFRLN